MRFLDVQMVNKLTNVQISFKELALASHFDVYLVAVFFLLSTEFTGSIESGIRGTQMLTMV